MGTRSLTRFFQDDKEIVCVYQQFDGYPNGAGAKLAKFLKSGRMVNGIPMGKAGERFFNGMGCLAAQFVADYKTRDGGFYLYAPGSVGCGEEYTYEVHGGFGEGYEPKQLTVKCTPKYEGYKPFAGTVDEFTAWCARDGQDEEEAA